MKVFATSKSFSVFFLSAHENTSTVYKKAEAEASCQEVAKTIQHLLHGLKSFVFQI